MLRPEQKSVALCRELISRYSKPEDIVFDPFAGTFTTAEACLTVPGARRFVGGDKDETCVQAGEERCLYAFLRAILGKNGTGSFVVSDDVAAAADTYFKRHFSHMDRVGLALSTDALPLPVARIPYTQAMPYTMCALLANLRENTDFVSRGNTVSGPDKWKGTLYSDLMLTDADVLQTAQCAQLHLTRTPARSLAALREFQQGEDMGNYYGTLVFVNMAIEGGPRSTYGNGMHTVTKRLFQSHGVPILRTNDEVVFGNTSIKKLYIVPAPFCPFASATFPSAETQANAALYVSPKPTYTIEEVVRHTLVTVRATSRIGRGDVILLSRNVQYV